MKLLKLTFCILVVLFGCTRLSNQVRPTTLECGEDFVENGQAWFQVESADGELLRVGEFEIIASSITSSSKVQQSISSKGCFSLVNDIEWIIRAKEGKESKLISKEFKKNINSHRIRLEPNEVARNKLSCPVKAINASEFTLDQIIRSDDLANARLKVDIELTDQKSKASLYQDSLFLHDQPQYLLARSLGDGSYHLKARVYDLRRAQVSDHECDFEVDNTAPEVDLDRSHLTQEERNGRNIYVIPRQEQLRFRSPAENNRETVQIDYCFQPIAENELNLEKVKSCEIGKVRVASFGEPVSPLINSGSWVLQFSAVDSAGNRSEWKRIGPIFYIDNPVIQQIQLESRSDMIQTEISKESGVFDVLYKTFRNFAAWKALSTSVEKEKTRDSILSLFYAIHIGMNNYARFLSLNDRSNKIVMTRDGQRLIAGLYNGDILIIDTKTNQVRKTLSGHRSTISSLWLSQDERILMSGGYDQVVKMWDFESGNLLTSIPCCQGEFLRAVLSPDEKQIVSSSWNKVLNFWSDAGILLKSVSVENDPNFHRDVIMSLKTSPDGQYIATASWDRTVRLWDFAGNFVRKMQTDHSDGVNDIAFSSDSKQLVSVGKDGQILAHNVADGSLSKKLATLPAAATAIAIGGQTVVVGSVDNAIRVWNLTSGQQLNETLKFEYFGMDNVAVNGLGTFYAASTNSSIIRLWGAGGPSEFVNVLSGHRINSSIRSLVIDGQSQRLFSSGTDRQILSWGLNSFDKEWSNEDATDTVYELKISPQRDFLYAASKDGHLRRYELPNSSSGAVVFESRDEWLFSLDFDPINSQVYLGTWNGLLMVPQDSSTARSREVSINGWSKVIFDPKRRKLLTLNRDWHLGSIDPETLVESKRLGFNEALITGKLSQDRNSLFLGIWNGQVSSVDVESFTENYHFDSGGGIVWDLWHHPATGYLITATNDGRLRIWNPKERKLLGVPMQISTKAVRSLIYAEEKSAIITGDDDGLIKVWNVPLTQDVEVMKTLVCKEAGAVLRAEWFEERYNFSLGNLCE